MERVTEMSEKEKRKKIDFGVGRKILKQQFQKTRRENQFKGCGNKEKSKGTFKKTIKLPFDLRKTHDVSSNHKWSLNGLYKRRRT